LAPCAAANCPVVDLPGFASMTLSSLGDIRFLPSAAGNFTTLTTGGNLALVAGQVYPVAGADAIVTAGLAYDPVNTVTSYQDTLSYNGTLTIAAQPGPVPAAPLTAGGMLTLRAEAIDQGGVVRAPDGEITLGAIGRNGQYAPFLNQAAAASQVVFLPGSITSVSMNGLTIPYGGTSDGTTYTVVLNGAATTALAPQLSVNAQMIQLRAGATIDVSGGGLLAGAGFVPGRGGSTDITQTPLLALTAAGTVTAPPPATNLVFAIIPGVKASVAPPTATATKFTGPLPSPGDEITVGAGVPGLPAGTYTLLPGSDALLPGAFRVQLATTSHTVLPGVTNLGNGSYLLNGYRGVANTGIVAALPVQVTVTPGAAVLNDAQYDQTSYAAFALSQAVLFGQARASLTLPADTKTLAFNFPATTGQAELALQIQGTVAAAPGAGGLGGITEISALAPIEVIANGATPTAGMVSVRASDISGLDANTLIVGGTETVNLQAAQAQFNSATPSVTIRDGATLSAAQVFLVSAGAITVERGATITTIGAGVPSLDSSSGLVFNNENESVLAVSNGTLAFVPATIGGAISIGTCGSVCSGAASLFSAGTIETVTTGEVTLDPTTQLGTAALNLSASTVNFGTPPAGTPGLTLTLGTLQSLLAGNVAPGVPALQQLTLSASKSVNFYGTFAPAMVDPITGQPTLASLQLNTPAIYGAAGVNASLTTGTFIWNGVQAGTASLTPGVWAGSGGSASSSLSISANTIVLGYGPADQAQNTVALNRLILGFDNVDLTATGSIAGNNQGTLSVYQSATQDARGNLLTMSGGNLALVTPLLTGAPGSELTIAAGGNLAIAAPGTAPAAAGAGGQGASLTLNAANISNNTAIVLPSGLLVMNAQGSIALNDGSRLDLAGVTSTLFDQSTSGWGGSVRLQAGTGGITQTAGGAIDVSAGTANAGTVTMIAPGAVNLAGAINGGAAPGYTSGSFSVRAGRLGAGDASTGFAALNAILDAGKVFGGRSFELLGGDLTIAAGTTVTANSVSVSVDAGALTVAGTVNASGTLPGRIRLSAGGDLTLAGGAVLDAHGTAAQVDSYGQPIDAENTASVTLTSVNGVLSIAPGPAPVIDVSAAQGVTCAFGLCGQVTLNAPRVNGDAAGDIGISVPMGVNILGAGRVLVTATRAYDTVSTITQAWFDQTPYADATTFMNAAVGPAGTLNSGLATKLAGLLTPALAPAFQLQPGVEIDSPTPTGGLTLSGDLDLSRFRFQSVSVSGGTGGLTEPGALVIRAGGVLTINGNINDGFSGAPTLPAMVPNASNPLNTSADTTVNYSYWELAQPLPPNADGSPPLSWSIRLVAGADLTAADSRTVLPSDQLTAAAAVPVAGSIIPAGATVTPGSIELYDPHSQPVTSVTTDPADLLLPGWSVIRTGTGDLDVLAGGSVNELSTYAIYTAGAVVPAAPAFNLPRGTTSPILQTLSGTALFTRSKAGTTTIQGVTSTNGTANTLLPTALKDPSGNVFFVTNTITVVNSGGVSKMFETVNGVTKPITSIPIVASSAKSAFTDPSGTLLALAQFSFIGTTAQIQAPATVGQVFTVLGTSGQATSNGITLGSLVNNYQAYYPAGGGNLLISAGGNIAGYLASPSSGTGVQPMDEVGNWLWRQGGGGASTAWWINFGTLALPLGQSGSPPAGSSVPVPTLTGFTGIGTLGGGNVTILAGGNVGTTNGTSTSTPAVTAAIDVAIASTGQLAQGAGSASGITQTGGGVLTIRAGGTLNGGGAIANNNQANGTLTDTRGAIGVLANSIGQIALQYGAVNFSSSTNVGDPRVASSVVPSEAVAQGGPIVVPGDATVSLEARGDLVLGGVGDPTRLAVQNLTPANLTAGGAATGLSWFSLWQPDTAINLVSAGGNLVVSTQASVAALGGQQENAVATDNRFLYPPSLTAVAASGSIYAGTAVSGGAVTLNPSSIELAPSPHGQLELLAARSIYDDSVANGQPQSFDVSGASAAALASPLNPAFVAVGGTASNLAADIGARALSLFAFGLDTASGSLHAGDPAPALIYAGGDIVDMRYGETLTFLATSGVTPAMWYVSGKAVRVMAGGDIVEPGTVLGQTDPPTLGNYTSTSGLIVNNNPTDVSVIQAGGEIIYANATVAGPGQLYVQAGGTVYQGNLGALQSLGPLSDGAITAGSTRTGGAGITVLAGAGASGPDWTAFARTYLAPDMGYGPALLTYLQSSLGFTGGASDAASFFEALPIEQQRGFLLQIYFDELRDSGREFTDPTGIRYKSYVRGRTAIATLFPAGSAGSGDITMFGDSGISTDFGGGIMLLTPGGATTLGNTTPPPVSATPPGVLSQGTGDVDIYSLGSVILGQSRVFTTFGGNILMWSATGDINAGIGVKSTQLVSTALIAYDAFGRVTLTPGIPSSGAGIATLAPIPGTPKGDVDLVAPEGVVDAGEAGIRVSGNVNVAALSIVNAANLQVGGKSSGLPAIAAPNVAALSAASGTAAAAAQSAQGAANAAAAQNNQPVPSTITVELIGFGEP
jgi:hypothetical protein